MGGNSQQQSTPYQSMMGNGYGMGMMGQGGMMSSGSMMSNYGGYCHQYVQNTSTSARAVMVMISGYSFCPSNLTIERGTTITWVNMDSVTHTVTSGTEQNPTNLFDSHELSFMQELQLHIHRSGCLPVLL